MISETVRGLALDAQSRCAHWHGPNDILAIRFACCGEWYACAACHTALAGHEVRRWGQADFTAHALRCGACAGTFSINAYLVWPEACPHCAAAFNPRCRLHHALYFETEAAPHT